MFEPRGERILLGLALGLLGAVALDRAVIRPLGGYLSGASSRIAELHGQIAGAEQLERTAPLIRQQSEAVRRRLRGATEQEQNEFRGYLAAQLGGGVELTSSAQIAAVEVPSSPELRRISYELRLLGPQEALRRVLANLDASEELLRGPRRLSGAPMSAKTRVAKGTASL